MKIITVNLPISYLNAMDSLVGTDGLYPSRSELIRVAVRDFLMRELEAAKNFAQYQTERATPTRNEEIDQSLYVQVPIGEKSMDGSPEFKTYRIVKK